MQKNEPQLSADMRENLYNILANFVNIVDDCHARGVEPDCNNEINLIEKALATALEEQKKEILGKIPNGYTKKLKIGENDYACKQLKCTMEDIKEHNIESEGFDLGYKTAIDDIRKWKTEYLNGEKTKI